MMYTNKLHPKFDLVMEILTMLPMVPSSTKAYLMAHDLEIEMTRMFDLVTEAKQRWGIKVDKGPLGLSLSASSRNWVRVSAACDRYLFAVYGTKWL